MNDLEAPVTIFEFANPATVKAWAPIDDRVMGGISSSLLRHDPAGHAVFQGNVSLERNGGFASIRSTSGNRGRDGARVCLVEARGDGKHYKVNLLSEDTFDGVSYQASFTAEAGDWQIVRIPLADFRPTFRGREVAGAPSLNPAHIRQVGLMIAERQAGAFALAIRRISLA